MSTYDAIASKSTANTPSEHLTGKSEDEDDLGYWKTDEEVLEAVQGRRNTASRTQDDWRDDANEAYKFVAGKQWDDEDIAYNKDILKKPLITFNRVGPIVNAVCGQQICNRQETRFLPREGGNMKAAEIWSKVVSWAREECDAEDEESDAFRDLVITGMGWTCTNVIYDQDPSGMIQEQRTDPRRMRWDPSSRKKNLADARWVQCDYWFDDDEIEERWPGSELEIAPKARFNDSTVSQPHDATNAWRYQKNNSGLDEIEGKYRVIHEIHWRLEDVYQIPDLENKVTSLTKDKWDQLQARLKELGMPIPKVAQTKGRKYYEAWTVGDTVLHSDIYPSELGFEYQAMTGLRDERGAWYGLVLPLMDPQRFANKTFTQIVGILNSNAKGGLIAESSAVDNQRKFEQEWAKSDGVAWVADGAVSNGRIQPKPPPQIPAELTKLLEYSVGGMREVTGVNVEFLGQTDKVQPGIVEMMRTKAGLVILAPWFDAMRLYMKRQGRLLGEYIYTYISDGRWIRISGLDNEEVAPPAPPMGAQMGMSPPGMGMPPQGMGMPPPNMGAPGQGMPAQGGGMPPMPSQNGQFPLSPLMPGGLQYVQLIKNPSVLKFDLVVDESTQSRDSRERNFQALMTIVPMALQSGVPVPPEVIEYAPLPETLRAKWMDLIKKQQAAQKEPPLALQIEKMRGDNAAQLQNMKDQTTKEVESMKAALKQHGEDAKNQSEASKQMYQAQSQQIVDQSKLHMDAVIGEMENQREVAKMQMEAKLNTFEVLLKAVVDAHSKAQDNAMKMQQDDMKSESEDNGLGAVMPQIAKLMTQGQQQMEQLMRVLAAPEEIVRDASGKPTGKRKVLN